jgi:hypothetical protein
MKPPLVVEHVHLGWPFHLRRTTRVARWRAMLDLRRRRHGLVFACIRWASPLSCDMKLCEPQAQCGGANIVHHMTTQLSSGRYDAEDTTFAHHPCQPLKQLCGSDVLRFAVGLCRSRKLTAMFRVSGVTVCVQSGRVVGPLDNWAFDIPRVILQSRLRLQNDAVDNRPPSLVF